MKTDLQKQKEKYEKKLKARDEEIVRLNKHLERGKELLHRVTSEMGVKQNERDLASARAEMLHKLVICLVEMMLEDWNFIPVPIERVKTANERWQVDIDTKDGNFILSLSEVQKEAEAVGTEDKTELALVSAPGTKENEPAGDSQDIRYEENAGLPGDQGTQG